MEFHTGIENRNCDRITNHTKLSIDWEGKLESWARQDRMYTEALAHPAFLHRLALSYENDIYEDPRNAAKKVNAFLGRDVTLSNPLMAHTTDCPLPSIIANYDEGISMTSDTLHEYLMEPDGGQQQLPRSEVLVGMCKAVDAEVGLEYLPCATASED